MIALAGTHEGALLAWESRRGLAPSAYVRPVVRRVTSIEQGVRAILKGEIVELNDADEVHTILTRLAAVALEAKAHGARARDYDLCKVQVAGKSFFCAESLRTTEYPRGIPRLTMPQFTGKAVPGSRADRLPRNARGNVNAGDDFQAHLTALGITLTDGQTLASKLRPTQNELGGADVAGMMTNAAYDPAERPVFVSRDNYIIDGHHRWAAVVGRNLQGARRGTLMMRTIRIDAPISEVLTLAKAWAKAFGMAEKAVALAVQWGVTDGVWALRGAER